MHSIHLTTQDGDRIVSFKQYTIKVFSKYDDFAWTKAGEFAQKLNKMPEQEFKDKYPQFFL